MTYIMSKTMYDAIADEGKHKPPLTCEQVIAYLNDTAGLRVQIDGIKVVG